VFTELRFGRGSQLKRQSLDGAIVSHNGIAVTAP
jgi:hypothetical protein